LKAETLKDLWKVPVTPDMLVAVRPVGFESSVKDRIVAPLYLVRLSTPLVI
jgi:hypothetical protein